MQRSSSIQGELSLHRKDHSVFHQQEELQEVSLRFSLLYRILHLVGVLLGLFVLDPALPDLIGQLGHREAGVDAPRVLYQRLVNKLILFLYG